MLLSDPVFPENWELAPELRKNFFFFWTKIPYKHTVITKQAQISNCSFFCDVKINHCVQMSA